MSCSYCCPAAKESELALHNLCLISVIDKVKFLEYRTLECWDWAGEALAWDRRGKREQRGAVWELLTARLCLVSKTEVLQC